MGELVAIGKRRRPTHRAVHGPVEAKIIVFTGVRYDRRGETRPKEPAGPSQSGGGRRRV